MTMDEHRFQLSSFFCNRQNTKAAPPSANSKFRAITSLGDPAIEKDPSRNAVVFVTVDV
jgi:hypothetical protein